LNLSQPREPAQAAELAAKVVAAVRDDPSARFRLMRSLYEGGRSATHLPYGRAMTAFMRWQLRRGLLEPAGAPRPGSPWWRAINEAVLRDIAEARRLTAGTPGEPSSAAVAAIVDFIGRPSAAGWYRAHNLSIAAAYLAGRDLAGREDRVERYFLNVVLLRVLYAHALVGAPRLALGWLRPLGPALGDPRVGTTGIFLSLARTVPDRYPLGEDLTPFVAAENGFGRILDFGMIQPRLRALYDWSAGELGLPELAELLVGDVPAYAWDPADAAEWAPSSRPTVHLIRRLVPVRPDV
jgi:hypothetical protein